MNSDTKKHMYLPPMNTFGLRTPLCSHVPSDLSLECGWVGKAELLWDLCSYGSCGAAIAPTSSVEPKVTLSQPGGKAECEGEQENMRENWKPCLYLQLWCHSNLQKKLLSFTQCWAQNSESSRRKSSEN